MVTGIVKIEGEAYVDCGHKDCFAQMVLPGETEVISVSSQIVARGWENHELLGWICPLHKDSIRG